MSAGLYFGKFRSWETLLEWANVFVFHKIQSISFKSFTEMRKTAKSVNFYSILNLDYIIDSNMFCLLSFFELNKFPCFIMMMMMMMMMMVHMFANLYIYTTYSPVPNNRGGGLNKSGGSTYDLNIDKCGGSNKRGGGGLKNVLSRNVIGGKFCCRKPTISKELWTISLSYLL